MCSFHQLYFLSIDYCVEAFTSAYSFCSRAQQDILKIFRSQLNNACVPVLSKEIRTFWKGQARFPPKRRRVEMFCEAGRLYHQSGDEIWSVKSSQSSSAVYESKNETSQRARPPTTHISTLSRCLLACATKFYRKMRPLLLIHFNRDVAILNTYLFISSPLRFGGYRTSGVGSATCLRGDASGVETVYWLR